MELNKYRVWCNTDNKYEYVIGSDAPTVCPADAAHSIEVDSISVIGNDIKEVCPGCYVPDLSHYKYFKKKAIDGRTRDLIVSGITYNNVVFSSSETAQRNWLALDQFKAYHTYPVAVTAEDDSEHTFADATEVSTFVLTGMAIINGHYASGRALKISVDAAADEAAVDAVVDNR